MADRAVVVAAGNAEKNVSAALYIFHRHEKRGWVLKHRLLAPEVSNANFGSSLSQTNDTILIGAQEALLRDVLGDNGDNVRGPGSGSVILYTWNGSAWSKPSKLVAKETRAGDRFGCSVGMSGDMAIIGAFGHTNKWKGDGAAYIFKQKGGNLVDDVERHWVEVAELLAEDGDANDGFGRSVSMSSGIAAIGAAGDEHSGVDKSGSGYIFVRQGQKWVQQSKLSPSKVSAGARFGQAVSMSGHMASFSTASEHAFVFPASLTQVGWTLTLPSRCFGGISEYDNTGGHEVTDKRCRLRRNQPPRTRFDYFESPKKSDRAATTTQPCRLLMPIDINSLRSDRAGDPALVLEAQRKRFKLNAESLVEEVLNLDKSVRESITRTQDLQTQLNNLQKGIIAERKKQKLPCDEELAEAARLRQQLKDLELDTASCEVKRDEKLKLLGNVVDPSVPFSNVEEDNEVVAVWPRGQDMSLPCPISEFRHRPDCAVDAATHEGLLWRIGGYDPDRGAKVAGSRGYFLEDVGVMLNQALLNFGLAFLRQRGYRAMQPPYFMRRDLMCDLAQLSDFDEQLYKVTKGEDEAEKYLIATSEQPLCALHSKEILEEETLPRRYAGISTCFRTELGKAGKENKGIFRVHQFEKVEQFCITSGDHEKSQEMHLEMLRIAQDFYEALGISYRVVKVVSGELNDAAVMKFDLEGWFPSQGEYKELVSCSNCTDFQSRALDIRSRNVKEKPRFVHMLNSTLVASGRCMCCILETYQTPTGVKVPTALVPFMGLDFMPFVREVRSASQKTSKAPPSKSVPDPPPQLPMASCPVDSLEEQRSSMASPSATGVGAKIARSALCVGVLSLAGGLGHATRPAGEGSSEASEH
ncbi:unnamed protein product [Cladocopium goreaui]|uniref:serine--tRNA ligase n=1 Tax=Cladocopium goreaui TaxID=2562237 RepID=A0A9P1D4T4_9DINO|nr:unnamed protein product [Cladocopium goreaui]